MAPAREYLDTWHEGVIASADVSWPQGLDAVGIDHLLPTSSPRAWNTVLAIVGPRAVPRKRDGCTTMNRSPARTTPIIGQYPYRHRNTTTGAVTQYHLLVYNDGALSWMDETGAVTVLNASAFTVGNHFPDFAQLNNLLFIVNGEDATKLRGTTEENFGIVAPDNETVPATLSVDQGVNGSLDGTYEIAFTYSNSNTGHESSRSAPTASVDCFNKQITISSIPQSSDAQVDEIHIYIRDINRSARFFRIDTVDDGTTSTTVNAIYTNLTILGPDRSENDPPPDGLKFLAAHKGRLFGADDGRLYWSKVDLPEAWDPDANDTVNQDDGQQIRGLVSIPNGYLLILKEDAYYILDGDTPDTWQISRVGPAVGCLSHRSIRVGSDGVYWWADQGPVRLGFDALAAPSLIGADRISARTSRRALNFSLRDQIAAEVDVTGQRIVFAVPDAHQTRLTHLLIWSTRFGCWESDRWDPVDISSLTAVNDSHSEPFIMVGGYNGQVFKLGLGDSDGMATGTVSGTFVAATTSHSTLTDAAATFDTTGQALAERKVTVLDSDNLPVGRRVRVSSNTATVLTLASPVGGLTVGSTYTYIVGGPDWQFDTVWRDTAAPFDKKRLRFIYLLAMLYGRTIYVDVLRNQREDTLDLDALHTITGTGLLWNGTDSAGVALTWDTSLEWNGGTEVTYAKVRGHRTGTAFSARFRNPFASQPMHIMRVGFKTDLVDDKLA